MLAAASNVISERARKPARKRDSPWAAWSEEKKKEVAALYKEKGYPAVRLAVHPTPAASTIRGWVFQFAANGELCQTGRPSWLAAQREEQVVRAFMTLWKSGAIVDYEVLTILGEVAMKQARGANTALPPLSHHWVKSFR